MASAQQKPKATKADKRNPARRNGKAFGKNRDTEPKFSGNSIMGYKKSRVEAWAAAANQTVEEWKSAYRLKRKLRTKTKKAKLILVA